MPKVALASIFPLAWGPLALSLSLREAWMSRSWRRRRQLWLLEQGQRVWREDGGEGAMEDAVEDERQDEGDEADQPAAIEGA